MTGRPLLWIVVAGLALVHFFLHVGLGIGRAAPDLLTVALLIAAPGLGIGSAAALGFLFGLFEDALSLLAFGANTLALVLVAMLGVKAKELFVGDSLWFMLTYFFAGKWVRDLLHWMASGDGVREPFLSTIFGDSLLSALYAAVVGLGVLWLLGRGEERVRAE